MHGKWTELYCLCYVIGGGCGAAAEQQSWKIHSILPIHTCIYSYLYKYLYNTCILYQLDITDCAYMQNSALYGALHTCMMRAIIVDLYCIFSQLSHTCI